MKNKIPTIYCDTSFLMEYWEAYELQEIPFSGTLLDDHTPPHYSLIKSIIGTEKKKESLRPIRRLIEYRDVEIELISSVFGLLEIYELYSEWNMKANIAEATNIDRVFNKSRKQIGDYILGIYNSNDDSREHLMKTLIPYNLKESLPGIEFKDIDNLNLKVNDFLNSYLLLSTFQVGPTDIMHLIAAKHLKAEYFVSFDSDYKRIKGIVNKNLDIRLILSVPELEDFLKQLQNNTKI